MVVRTMDFPGVGTPPIPVADPLKALALDAPGIALTPPFTPGVNPETLFGFGDAQLMATNPPNVTLLSGERELTKCFDDASITTVAVSDHGYVPHATSWGGTECVDYPEESPTTSAPPANTQGPGNVALAGCNLAGAGHNACTDPATAP